LGRYSFVPKKTAVKIGQKNVLPVTKSTSGKIQQNNVSNTTFLKALKFIIFISGIVDGNRYSGIVDRNRYSN